MRRVPSLAYESVEARCAAPPGVARAGDGTRAEPGLHWTNVKRLFAILALALVASAVMAVPALADHSWGSYHWARTANPFTITLGDNVDSRWDGFLATTSGDWSRTTAGNPLRTAVGTGGTTGRKCRATTGRVEVCSASYGRTRWLGVAQIWLSGGHIVQGTAKVNDTYLWSSGYNDFWRLSVLCQEVGHTFGLDHQDESGADFHTCMDYADNPDADNTHPNTHDYEQLAAIYQHLDSTTTISAGQAGSGRAAPYRTVRSDRARSSRIEERFADGTARVTVILWAG